ncbi:MAG: SagB/ThcOx family dehydrogenase [Verrucomicrobia bacterium]|nr:SagB/ThcOx family dehydrogenase [Verrucomicrobiota bacterium]
MNSMVSVLDYHDRTKHDFKRFARSLGYLDWANQPNPFRRFEGAPLIHLEEMPPSVQPTYDSLFGSAGARSAAPPDAHGVAQLFYDSFALSAWKVAGESRWSLRANPSSGNLHPTEAYLLSGPIEGLFPSAALCHYTPFEHALELRRSLPGDLWDRFRAPTGCDLMIGLTSIHWREAWKYGERAYRYCQHDVGHAIAGVVMACAVLGWEVRLLETIGDGDLAQLLAVDRQSGFEAEHPDVLLGIGTGPDAPVVPASWPDPEVMTEIRKQPELGEPNQLSQDHQPWPIIDAVAAACEKPPLSLRPIVCPGSSAEIPPARQIDARRIIRQRRSAVAMDGITAISLATFLCQLRRTLPYQGHPVWRAWPWPASVHLALFVHRVEGLPPGLYWLDRDLISPGSCRTLLRPDFDWQQPAGCPATVPLHRLREGDFGEVAEEICCRQSIAAGGAYAVAMVAVMEGRLHELGPWFYRRLFWECGMIGQILYLEAEAAGVRATGIGCFFDDPMHQLLGISDHSCQSLYHFTVGGPVEDPRIQQREAYFHRRLKAGRR